MIKSAQEFQFEIPKLNYLDIDPFVRLYLKIRDLFIREQHAKKVTINNKDKSKNNSKYLEISAYNDKYVERLDAIRLRHGR